MEISRSTYTALVGDADGEGIQKVNIKLGLILSENTLIAYKTKRITKSEAKKVLLYFLVVLGKPILYETVVSTLKANKRQIKEKTSVKQW